MLYNHNNKGDIDKISLHDAIFEGLNYDYDKREICFICKHYYVKKIYSFRFHNVIYSKLQSSLFGMAEIVYMISIVRKYLMNLHN